MFLHRCLFMLVICGIYGCQLSGPSSSEATLYPRHLDFTLLAQSQMEELLQKPYFIQKIVRVNQELDTIAVQDSVALGHLFKAMTTASLHTDRFERLYKADTLVNAFNADTTIIIQAQRKKENPQKIILEIDASGRIQKVMISHITHTLLYQYQHDIQYERNRKLQSQMVQQLLWNKPTHMETITRMESKDSGL
jgi:hypothetical protein